MAMYRNIQMSFWTDPDIMDDYTPEDKLFYLYVLTNPHTNMCGCYEISVRQMAYEIGYSREETEELIQRASEIHNTIRYSNDTKELLILNWSKYNWNSSDKIRTLVENELQTVKNLDFKAFLIGQLNGEDMVSDETRYGIDRVSEISDRVSDENGYGIQKNAKRTIYISNTDTVTDTVININNKEKENKEKEKEKEKEIIRHLNDKCGTHYRDNTEKTLSLIRARFRDGFSLEDFFTVIDKKADEWIGTEQEKYLRPETLFGTKFEGYLNQKIKGETNRASPIPSALESDPPSSDNEDDRLIGDDEDWWSL